MENGRYTDKYQILPNTNEVSIIGHINFTELVFDTLEEAQTKAENLK